MTKIPWGPALSGGNLDNDNKKNIRKLIDNFGDVLEDQCIRNKINKFVFLIFRPFNLFAVLTNTKVILIFSAGAGMRNENWQDLRDKTPEPTVSDLFLVAQQQLGWSNLYGIQFPSKILGLDFESQKTDLINVANEWIENMMKETEKQEKIVRINPIFLGRDFSIEDDLCFVLMPFREPFDTIYKDHIRPIIEKKFRIKRADDILKSSIIIEDIWEHINKAKFILADVTGKNPNVFYEIGIAHTIGKEPVFLTQNKDDVPFDLKHRRYFIYSNDETGLKKLESYLVNVMDELFPQTG